MPRVLFVVVSAGLLGAGVILWHGVLKPLPEGLSVATEPRPARNARFMVDLAYVDPNGTRFLEQTIFDEILSMIRGARRQIVLDLFLFNDYQGPSPERNRPLSRELADALVEKKRSDPAIEIVFITDPINTVYGGLRSTHLDRLRNAGIPIVTTDLEALRDSNWLYSSLWRWFVRPFGDWWPGRFTNPFGGDPVSLATTLRMLNFKANHRKTIVADSPAGWVGLVTSANPHDGSSAHGNQAIRFEGPAVADLLETERAVAKYSGGPVPAPIDAAESVPSRLSLRVLTEGKIGSAIDEVLAEAQAGDEIAIAVFYLSDRRVVRGLIAARERGVTLRVLLDPSKDAFGRAKNGLPNRAVAFELHRAGIPLRWCDTHGEQCHSKMLLARRGDRSELIAGSANFTRRNLRDLNLETNVRVEGPLDEPFLQDAWSYFERVWGNEPGRRFSVSYEKYGEDSWARRWLTRASEFSGIGAH